jgi:aldose 1-epimerase
LVHGEQRAVVVELGAGLRQYHAGTASVVDGYEVDEHPEGGRGQLLIPWPNRIAEARYRFGDAEYQLPVTEPTTRSAIHGLTRSMLWTLVDAASDRVTLALDLQPQDGYPFRLGLSATYTLGADGLTARITAFNRGVRPCPYGAGAHPYVRLMSDGLIDDAWLHVPADSTLEADDRGIPTGAARPVHGTDFDFRSPRRIGALMLDTAYALRDAGTDGVNRISLMTPDRTHGVAVWMDRSQQFAMIYSGDGLDDVSRRRCSLAIEPMTCAPDAFNSGVGLLVLEPDEEHSSTWGISPF